MLDRRPTIARIREIADTHRPRGWEIEERGPVKGDYFKPYHGPNEFGETLAFADFEAKKIVCPPLVCRSSLFIYLHECGHVHMQHGRNANDVPAWEEEYEAERYAIDAMRSEGVAVPLEAIRAAKRYVRQCIESKYNDETVPRRIFRWAYGRG